MSSVTLFLFICSLTKAYIFHMGLGLLLRLQLVNATSVDSSTSHPEVLGAGKLQAKARKLVRESFPARRLLFLQSVMLAVRSMTLIPSVLDPLLTPRASLCCHFSPFAHSFLCLVCVFVIRVCAWFWVYWLRCTPVWIELISPARYRK